MVVSAPATGAAQWTGFEHPYLLVGYEPRIAEGERVEKHTSATNDGQRTASWSQTANHLRAFRGDLQLRRDQFPRAVTGTANRSSMLDTVLRAAVSAQGSSASPRIFCTVLR